jgi:hypothetical protein
MIGKKHLKPLVSRMPLLPKTLQVPRKTPIGVLKMFVTLLFVISPQILPMPKGHMYTTPEQEKFWNRIFCGITM